MCPLLFSFFCNSKFYQVLQVQGCIQALGPFWLQFTGLQDYQCPFSFLGQCYATSVPPQGFRCSANFYKKFHIRKLQLEKIMSCLSPIDLFNTCNVALSYVRILIGHVLTCRYIFMNRFRIFAYPVFVRRHSTACSTYQGVRRVKLAVDDKNLIPTILPSCILSTCVANFPICSIQLHVIIMLLTDKMATTGPGSWVLLTKFSTVFFSTLKVTTASFFVFSHKQKATQTCSNVTRSTVQTISLLTLNASC
jgi:hypothetical protein